MDHASDLREGNRYAYAASDPINLTDPTGAGIFGDIVDEAEDVAGSVKDVISGVERGVRNLGRSKGGRCLIGGVLYGSGATTIAKDYRIVLGAAAVGCAAGVTKVGF